MMSIRSLADFNKSSPGGPVDRRHRHRHRPGFKLPADTTSEEWGLLTGHQRGPRHGHTRGLNHGHGQDHRVGAVASRATRSLNGTLPGRSARRGDRATAAPMTGKE